MGSFNLQCGITKQTINDDDRVFIGLAVRNSGYGSVIISSKNRDGTEDTIDVSPSPSITTPRWETLSVFIEATAQDYGKFDIEDTLRNRLALGGLLNQMSKSTPAAKSDNDRDVFNPTDLGLPEIAEKLRALTTAGTFLDMDNLEAVELFNDMRELFGKVLDAANDGLCFYPSINRTYEPVQLCCIHGHAYDAMNTMADKPFESWMDTYKDKLLARPERKIRFKQQLACDNARPLDTFDLASNAIEVINEIEGGSGVGRNHIPIINPIEWMVNKATLPSAMDDPAILSEAIINSLGPIVEDGKVFSVMEYMNLRLEPVVYAGQDYQNDIGRAFMGLVQQVSTQIDKDLRERYGEDFDPDEDENESVGLEP